MNATSPTFNSPGEKLGTAWWARCIATSLPWLIALLVWMLLSMYMGLFHDAWLYTAQALGRLRPDLYSGDIFLRMGSQDNYTVFSPFYAAAIRSLGIEPAAAVLTLLSHLALFAAAWWLCRSFAPPRVAALCVGLMVTLPSDYGPGFIFHYIEGFITPRMLAEALVLAAIAMALRRTLWLSAVLIACAALVHPVMTAPGLAVIVALTLGSARPRLFAGLCAAFLAGTIVVGVLLPEQSPFHMGGDWRAAVEDYAPYLFITKWTLSDWTGPVGTLITLAVSSLALDKGPARRLAIAALAICVYFLMLNLIGSDMFHISLFTQGQAYRCLWLGGVVSVLLLPDTARALWNRGDVGQATVFGLAAFWLLRNELYAHTVAALLLLLSVVGFMNLGTPRTHRLIRFVAMALLGVAIVITIANNPLGGAAVYADTPAPEYMDRLRSALDDRLFAGAALLLVWWASSSLRDVRLLGVIATVLVAAIAALVPSSVNEWTHRRYTDATRAAFEPWRKRIPVGEEVLWYESPFDSWLNLERPSYFSIAQSGTALFSQAAAKVLHERGQKLQPYGFYIRLFVPLDGDMRKVRPVTLKDVCAAITARFVVSRVDLAAQPIETAPAGLSIAYRRYSLYQCDRSAG